MKHTKTVSITTYFFILKSYLIKENYYDAKRLLSTLEKLPIYESFKAQILWRNDDKMASKILANNIIDIYTRGSKYGVYLYGAFTFYAAAPGAKNVQHNTISLRGETSSTFATVAGIYGFNLGSSDFSNNIISNLTNKVY